VCGSQPTLGLDVHPKLRFSRERSQEVSNFVRELQSRLQCITDGRKPGCPVGLATGSGTGFRLVTDHIAEFAKRGVCARDPQKALVDQVNMGMPRMSHTAGEFVPYSPAAALPYAHHWRLARNPNDTFLAGNTHREGISPFDDLQPAYAALYSGAFHPSAEGHSIVGRPRAAPRERNAGEACAGAKLTWGGYAGRRGGGLNAKPNKAAAPCSRLSLVQSSAPAVSRTAASRWEST
jgi:hypothetical protein